MNPMLMPMAFGSSVLCVALPVMRLQDHYAALALSATVKKDGKDRGKRKGNPGNQAEGKKTQ